VTRNLLSGRAAPRRLFYRLNVVHLEFPLRAPDALLADHQLPAPLGALRAISDDAPGGSAYRWPGNVRNRERDRGARSRRGDDPLREPAEWSRPRGDGATPI
jgi:hypothetical protein